MTGQELYKYFQQKSGYAYTGNLDTTKANRLFKEALILSVEGKYRELVGQKEYDELSLVIKTNKVYTPIQNQLYTIPFFYVSNVTYTAVSGGQSIITITTSAPHNLATGNSITTFSIGGISTTPSGTINGQYTITVLNSTQFSYVITVSAISGTYTSGTGTVVTANYISDYWHLLTVKSKYVKNTYNTITGVSSTTPIEITVSQRNNFRTGESLSLASIGGNTAANGVVFIKTINSYTFSIYSDKDLQTPIASNGTYTNGGTISRIYYNYCTKVYSDQKIATFTKREIDIPGFEETENLFRFYPLDETAQEVMIDYISVPPYAAIIDVSNNTNDLEKYWNIKFLYFIVDTARAIFAEKYRDTELYQQSQQSKIQNP